VTDQKVTRREFLRMGVGAAAAIPALPLTRSDWSFFDRKAVVAITRVRKENVAYAVEEAIDLLGGIRSVTRGKERIMLKPNLVAESPAFTTKPEVIGTLARLMKDAGKDVSIGEGSAAANGFNVKGGETFRTKNRELLDRMQNFVFDQLGYSDLARLMGIPLVNLHSGELITVPVPGGLAFKKINLHHLLAESELLCSVPMMKTHVLATVSLGMKNLIGLYPGTVYGSVRSGVHDHAAGAGSPGVAYEILDMLSINRVGLVVVDGSIAMEGDGPTGGQLVKMGVIVAGTNPLATDMVAARVMGFRKEDIPAFIVAQKAGLTPMHIDEIELRGEKVGDVERKFARPNLVRWESISHSWGVREIP
jgi:uncharacterized protein (DUF362 family)